MIQKFAMSLNSPHIRLVAAKLLDSLFNVLETGDVDVTSRDAMMAVGSLAYNLGADFQPYMDRFHPYIIQALDRFSNSDPSIEVWDEISSVIADCCFALGTGMNQYEGAILSATIRGLRNHGIRMYDRIILCEIFSHIAMAIGGPFVDNLGVVLAALLDFYCDLSSEAIEFQGMHFSREYEDKFFVSYYLSHLIIFRKPYLVLYLLPCVVFVVMTKSII
jgi:hypothetical protein